MRELFDEYTKMSRFISEQGELKYGSMHGRIFMKVYENTVGGFSYSSDPDSEAIEVVNLENFDPFFSIWDDGRACRCHLGRYKSLDRIKEHYRLCGGVL